MRPTAIVCALLTVGPASLAAEEASPPPPAAAEAEAPFHLMVMGGPTRADVDVLLNGQFVATVGSADGPVWQSVADLVRPGLNEVKLVARNAEEPREPDEDLRIRIAPVRARRAHQNTIEESRFEAVVPANASFDAECVESGTFSAGPPPTPPKPVKNRYWLFVSGPPTNHRMMVRINDWVVTSVSGGIQILEVTPFLAGGKNTVTFEGGRACFKPESGRDGTLTFTLGLAKMDHEVVNMEMPLATFELFPKDKRETIAKKQNFRAW